MKLKMAAMREQMRHKVTDFASAVKAVMARIHTARDSSHLTKRRLEAGKKALDQGALLPGQVPPLREEEEEEVVEEKEEDFLNIKTKAMRYKEAAEEQMKRERGEKSTDLDKQGDSFWERSRFEFEDKFSDISSDSDDMGELADV